MSQVPVYLSHGRQRDDRDVNEHFWRALCGAGFSFAIDPAAAAPCITGLELMMARSAGFVAIVPFRAAQERYRCPPSILCEYRLAVQARQPRLVLRDKRVPPRYFRAPGTVQLEFDIERLDCCAGELSARLDDFLRLTYGRAARRPRQGRVGIALASGPGRDGPDAGAPGPRTRRAVVEAVLEAAGHDVVDLGASADDPSELAQCADGCDFAIVDVDDQRASRIADFLLGRGTPLLKMARHGAEPIEPTRLLGSAPLRRAAADELVMHWTDLAELESRLRHQVARATADRTELTCYEAGHRYFRGLGRQARPVFISNAGAANEVARDLARALSRENIPFFHYRFQNPIGSGERWADQLGRIVASSRIFVPLVDDSYWDSEYCRKEYAAAVRLAAAGQISIVPGLLSGHPARPAVPYQGSDLRGRPRPEQVRLMVSRLDELLGNADDRTAAPGARRAPDSRCVLAAAGDAQVSRRPRRVPRTGPGRGAALPSRGAAAGCARGTAPAAGRNLVGHRSRLIPARAAPDSPAELAGQLEIRGALMSEQEIACASTSRAVAARNAGQYLRELLRSEQRYRHSWIRYRHERERDVHQLSVAKVLAAELRRNPRRNYDPDVTHEQLVHLVSRALKPKGTVLARDTLELFIRAFGMSTEHADQLWRQWAGEDLARVIVGRLAEPDGTGSQTALPYKTIALREYHYLGSDGRPRQHRTIRDIRSLADGLAQYRYSLDTGEVSVERISGGQPGRPYQRHERIWSVDITLPRRLRAGEEHSLEFETRFHYQRPADACLRCVAHERLENVVMRVEFDPRQLPRQVYWTEWLDYREPYDRIVREDPVRLDSEHAADHRLDVLHRAVAGFRWEF